MRKLNVIIFILAGWFLTMSGANAQASSLPTVSEVATRLNRERISRGLVPLAVNAQLTASAQAHANDIARTGNYGHTGSDGSTVFDRVARTSYGAYSWGRRLGENWAWYATAERAVVEWMDSAPHRNNILHTLYREMGIGIAPAKSNIIFVVDFGSQPNVLPFFINGYESETRSTNVTLTFSVEEVAPNGENANVIGRATEMQISNTSDFSGATWQPFAKQIAWTLPPETGAKSVYVKYRDARGRIATAMDSIVYNPSGETAPRGAMAPALVLQATSSPTVSITATPTRRPATATATNTRAAPTSTPTVTATPTVAPTMTAVPTVTSTPAIVPTATPIPDTLVTQDMGGLVGGAGLIVAMIIVLGLARFLAERHAFS